VQIYKNLDSSIQQNMNDLLEKYAESCKLHGADTTSKETNSGPTSQKILRLLWNKKVHCLVRRSPPMLPILNQMNPDNIIYLRSILILSSHLNLRDVFPLAFLTKTS
jgi:hypothetical protein